MKGSWFVAAIALGCCWPALAEVPLPADISIAAPDPELRKELAAFFGTWEGNWSGNLDAVLIVEDIDDQEAKVNAWGNAPVWNTKQAYGRYRAKVSQDGKASFSFHNPSGTINFTVTMNRDLATVNVLRTSPKGTNIQTFKKVAQ